MLPPTPAQMPGARAEWMLIARVIIAVGLALLLVVGAWSTSHGAADVHAASCLAPGVSHPAGTATDTTHDGAIASVDTPAAGAVVCLAAVLCCMALVLLVRRLPAPSSRVLRGRSPLAMALSRAGPPPFLPALTLTQLSISRT